tara:strand:+ start:9862 stop:10884 length:1023 start_codon:yes stop_codon:yes gene_type:complete
LIDLDKQSAQEDFWDDTETAQEVLKKASSLREWIENWSDIDTKSANTLQLIEEAIEADLTDLEKEFKNQLLEINKSLEDLEIKATLSGKYDSKSAILSIQAGAGGIDSQDWAEMLLNMYSRWAENRSYAAKVLNWSDGDEAGIKRADLEISGEYSYGYLKGEAGVHRLIRLSPFDNQHQRHTSFALIEVLPEPEKTDREVTIDQENLRIDYFRASGAGGQSVQKNATAVRMVHEPTGITVSVQNERSQIRNKEVALKIITARLIEMELKLKREEESKLRGEFISPEWGNQIRTYVLHPYKMIKDHRTEHETQDIESVFEGDLDQFLNAYLESAIKNEQRD